MQSKYISVFLLFVYLGCFIQIVSAQLISSNSHGLQSDYYYEYFSAIGDGYGTMTLGEGGDFGCSWNTSSTIMFSKGKKPGSKSQIITYSASCNSTGASTLLAAYGWAKNPAVEFYIVDYWDQYKPLGSSKIGTYNCDSSVYELFESTAGSGLIQPGHKQFLSVRQTKRTSGTITCGEHFDAWAVKSKNIGELEEISFLVDGYISSGNAEVKMSMTSGSTSISGTKYSDKVKKSGSGSHGTNAQIMMSDCRAMHPFFSSHNNYRYPKVYNLNGQLIATLSGNEYSTGKQGVIVSKISTGKIVFKGMSER
jgi:endo-1,4-beta-xylanase